MSISYTTKRRTRRLRTLSVIGLLMVLDVFILHYSIVAISKDGSASLSYLLSLLPLVVVTIIWLRLLRRFIDMETHKVTPSERARQDRLDKIVLSSASFVAVIAYCATVAAALQLLDSLPFVSSALLVFGFLFVVFVYALSRRR